ncbi:hypothetical protein D083_1190 [Dickeya solani RNS 08.23.3.1.A]|nr:hypothetical protein D083_1190 [Dickeya solani RNS 08.23.3.1.A]
MYRLSLAVFLAEPDFRHAVNGMAKIGFLSFLADRLQRQR